MSTERAGQRRASAPVLSPLTSGAAPGREESKGWRGRLLDVWSGLGHFTFHPPLRTQAREALQRQADLAARGAHAWDPARPLAEARSAHHTNTLDDFAKALAGPFDWLEGDVWLEGAARRLGPLQRWREPIMAHDPLEYPTLRTAEWLELGIRSGKGLKLDLKHAAAVPEVLALLERHPVPAGRLMINMDVVAGPGAPRGPMHRLIEAVSDRVPDRRTLERIRMAQPHAIISLGIATRGRRPEDRYSEVQVSRLLELARTVGAPVQFALRSDLVTPELVAKLRPFGKVGVWNDPAISRPADLAAERARFLAMGCEGIVDLRG